MKGVCGLGAVIVAGTAAAQQQPIKEDLFLDFVRYIDRGQQTTRTYLTNLRQFLAWMRFRAVGAPQRADIISYRDWLSSDHDAILLDPGSADGWIYRTDRAGNRLRVQCKPTTVKQYLQSVKHFFSWAAGAGLYPDIAKGVHGPKIREAHRKDSLTARDVQIIEASIACEDEKGKRLLAMYLLAVNAGMRTVELSRANVRDVETRNGAAWIYIWGKGHAEPDTRKQLAPAVYAAIRDYLGSRADLVTGGSPLFVSTGNRSGGKRIAPTTISTMLKRALQAAGYDSPRLTAHSLRHTAGQNVLRITGSNIYLTQFYMRHSSPKTTEIYLDNENAAQDADIAARLYEFYHADSN